MAEDDLDIYDDLLEFQQTEEKKSKELEEWENKYTEVQKENDALRLENKKLCKKIKTIEINFQNLLETAQREVKRLEKTIAELRKEKDDICFRRKRPNLGKLGDNQSINFTCQLGPKGTAELSSSDVLSAVPSVEQTRTTTNDNTKHENHQAASCTKNESRNTEKHAERIQDEINNTNLADQRFEKRSNEKRSNEKLSGRDDSPQHREHNRARKDKDKRSGNADPSRDRHDRYSRENRDRHVGSRSRADDVSRSRHGRHAKEDRDKHDGAARNKAQKDGDAVNASTVEDSKTRNIPRSKTHERNEHHHVRKERDKREDRNRRHDGSCKRGRTYEDSNSSHQNERNVRKCIESLGDVEGNLTVDSLQHQNECKESPRESENKKNESKESTPNINKKETLTEVSLMNHNNKNTEIIDNICPTTHDQTTKTEEEIEKQKKFSPNSLLIHSIVREVTTMYEAMKNSKNEEFKQNESVTYMPVKSITDVNTNIAATNSPPLSSLQKNANFLELFGTTPVKADEFSPNALKNVSNILETNNNIEWTPGNEYTPPDHTTVSSNLTNCQSKEEEESVNNYFTPNTQISISSSDGDINDVPNIPGLDLVNEEQLPVNKLDKGCSVSDAGPNKAMNMKDETEDLMVSNESDVTSKVAAVVVNSVVKISDALKEALSQTLIKPVDDAELLATEDLLLDENASKEQRELIHDSEVVVSGVNVEEQKSNTGQEDSIKRSTTQNEDSSKDDDNQKVSINERHPASIIQNNDGSNKLCNPTTNNTTDPLSENYESISDESLVASSDNDETPAMPPIIKDSKQNEELCEYDVCSELSKSLIEIYHKIKNGYVEAENTDTLQNENDSQEELHQHSYIESLKDDYVAISDYIAEQQIGNNEQIDFAESGIDSGYSQESLQKEILDFKQFEENPCTDDEIVNYSLTDCEVKVKENEESPENATYESQTEEASLNVTWKESHQINDDLCSFEMLDKSQIEIIQDIRLPDVYPMQDDASSHTFKSEQNEQQNFIGYDDEDPLTNIATKQQLNISEVPSKVLVTEEVTMPHISNDAIELALSALHDSKHLSPKKRYSKLAQAEIEMKAQDQQNESNLTGLLYDFENMIPTSTIKTDVKEEHVKDLLDILNDSAASNRSEEETVKNDGASFDFTLSNSKEVLMDPEEQIPKAQIMKQNNIPKIENKRPERKISQNIIMSPILKNYKIPKLKKTNVNLTVLDTNKSVNDKLQAHSSCGISGHNPYIFHVGPLKNRQTTLIEPKKRENNQKSPQKIVGETDAKKKPSDDDGDAIKLNLSCMKDEKLDRKSFAEKSVINKRSSEISEKTLLHHSDTIIPEKQPYSSEIEHATSNVDITQENLLQLDTEMEQDVPTKCYNDSQLNETLELSELPEPKRAKLDSSIVSQQHVIETKTNELHTNDTQLSLPNERACLIPSSSLSSPSNTHNTTTTDDSFCVAANSSLISNVTLSESEVSSVSNVSTNNSSSHNASSVSGSVVTKRVTLGSSDYRFEKTQNNEIKLYVTRRNRNRNRRVLNETSVTPTSVIASTSETPSTFATPLTSNTLFSSVAASTPLTTHTPPTSSTPSIYKIPSTSETPSSSLNPSTSAIPSISEIVTSSVTSSTYKTPSSFVTGSICETPSSSETPWLFESPSSSVTSSTYKTMSASAIPSSSVSSSKSETPSLCVTSSTHETLSTPATSSSSVAILISKTHSTFATPIFDIPTSSGTPSASETPSSSVTPSSTPSIFDASSTSENSSSSTPSSSITLSSSTTPSSPKTLSSHMIPSSSMSGTSSATPLTSVALVQSPNLSSSSPTMPNIPQ